MTILLIENDSTDAEFASHHLKVGMGAVTTVVDTLAEGRSRLAHHHYNLVLLDLGLPDSTPESTLAAIPELSARNALAVLTGYIDPFLQAVNCGADAYIMKESMADPHKFVDQVRVAMNAYLHRSGLPRKSDDPREILKSMRETGAIPISELAAHTATPAQAESLIAVTLGIQSLHLAVEANTVLTRDHTLQLRSGAVVMDRIDVTTKDTNGKVKVLRKDTDALQTQVKALMDKDGERTALALNEAIRKQSVEAVTRGVWIMSKPTWRQLSVVGGVLAFLGADRLIAVIRTLAHLISHI